MMSPEVKLKLMLLRVAIDEALEVIQREKVALADLGDPGLALLLKLCNEPPIETDN